MCFNVELLLRVKGHNRIIVLNDPVNFIDPEGLAKGGKQKYRGDEFKNYTDEEVTDLSRNCKDKELRRKAQTEDKARKNRNKSKRLKGKSKGGKFGIYAPTPITWCSEFPESCRELFPDLFKEPCEK